MLLLFDIDGTLVSGASDAHAAALRQAIHEIHGVDVARAGTLPSPAGRTDGEIARMILLDAGISAERIDDLATEIRERSCEIYARVCPRDLSDTVVAGIPELLRWLSSQEEVRLGLLTGNFEAIARLKLRRAGIGGYFAAHEGAFGSDSEDRSNLPEIARRRAGTEGHPYPRERTVVIGDTPRDIACARADRVRCVALATGPYGVDQLAHADAVAKDALALRDVLSALIH